MLQFGTQNLVPIKVKTLTGTRMLSNNFVINKYHRLHEAASSLAFHLWTFALRRPSQPAAKIGSLDSELAAERPPVVVE